MSELVQFVVLQRSEKWVVKSRELERAFGDRRKAIHCAIELANESGKNGKPALVLAGSRRHEFAPIWTFGKDPYPLARSVFSPACQARPSQARPSQPSRGITTRRAHHTPTAGSLHQS